MPSLPPTFAEDVIDQPTRVQLEVFLDEHRAALQGCLDGLTEEQARRSLVPSRTTLLGLVKHATFVERVWFDEAITCRSRAEIGLPATPDESFILDDDDTIASVQRAHRNACESSRRATSALGLDEVVRGNRRGPLPLRWVYLHVLRELAQHCGHADILREQLTELTHDEPRPVAPEAVPATDERADGPSATTPAAGAVAADRGTADREAADREAVADVVRTFFAAFTSGPDSAARLDALRAVFVPEAVIVRTGGGEPAVYGVDGFIAPRQALLSGGTLLDFREWELAGHTEIFGDIAQHFCSYAKAGVQDGTPFTARGMKSLQLVRTAAGWRISAAAWDDERDGLQIEPHDTVVPPGS